MYQYLFLIVRFHPVISRNARVSLVFVLIPEYPFQSLEFAPQLSDVPDKDSLTVHSLYAVHLEDIFPKDYTRLSIDCEIHL